MYLVDGLLDLTLDSPLGGLPGLCLHADNGSGGSGGGGGSPSDDDDDDGDDADRDGGDIEFDDAQQEKVNEIVSQRLKREREKWEQKLEEERKQREREAEEKRLQQKEEYKELADQRQERITGLEVQVGEIPSYKDRIEELEAALGGYAERLREGLPSTVTSLLDGRDVVEQLRWINEHAEELESDEREGLPPTPKPKGSGEISDDEKRKRSADARSVW